MLRIPASRSLKEKRRVVHSLRDRLQNRFKVSGAETDLEDEHGRAELFAVLVTSDVGLADALLERLDRVVASEARAQIVEQESGRL